MFGSIEKLPLEGFWKSVLAISEVASKAAAGTIGCLTVVEGMFMGLTKIFIDNARKRAREEGRKEVLEVLGEKDREAALEALRQRGVSTDGIIDNKAKKTVAE